MIYAILYLAILGIASHYIGNALPRSWFDATKFPYKCYSWEDGGKVYKKLGVHRWKDKAPDMSRVCTDMRPKTVRSGMNTEDIAALTAETCVAECVHWALILLSPGVLFISPNLFGAILFMMDILLLNLPFIVIQRYNRPKLVRYCGALAKREARGGAAYEAMNSAQ